MSQTALGNSVGLTFQQVQKYERGSNRMGSSRLYEFAKVLDVPVSYFFDEMPSNALVGRPMSGRGRKDGFGEAGTPFKQDKDPLIKREARACARLLQNSRRQGPQTHLPDDQGSWGYQPCRDVGQAETPSLKQALIQFAKVRQSHRRAFGAGPTRHSIGGATRSGSSPRRTRR
ncbi:MAG: helix-turn-helix domain-containing protein [Pseudomonadota bacterium]